MYPSLGEPLSKSAMPAVGFTFTVYWPGSGTAPDQATIEIIKDGQPVATIPSRLAAPDSSGRIQHAAAFPMATLVPGEYTLKVTVADGAGSLSRQAPFVVEP
jgi:hypothetical protein